MYIGLCYHYYSDKEEVHRGYGLTLFDLATPLVIVIVEKLGKLMMAIGPAELSRELCICKFVVDSPTVYIFLVWNLVMEGWQCWGPIWCSPEVIHKRSRHSLVRLYCPKDFSGDGIRPTTSTILIVVLFLYLILCWSTFPCFIMSHQRKFPWRGISH